MPRLFINYRRMDSEGYVGRLFDHLVRVFPREELFVDVNDIPPGADFVQVLEEAVAACDAFIAVIGPHWLTASDESGNRRLDQWNDFVRIEIASALKQGKRVIPVLVGRARMPAPGDLPEEMQPLARRHAFEISQQHFAQDVEKLARHIAESTGGVSHATKATPKAPAVASPEAPPSPQTAEKARQLKALRDELVNATASPLYAHRVENRYFPVLGDGNPDARILFIGESPGKYEAAEGRSFVGPSGAVLDEMLANIGLKRADVFITNLLLDFPPNGREPQPNEIEFYAPFVDRMIDIIQPAVIATLGRFAMTYLLRKLDLSERRGKISELHGKLIKTRLSYGEVHVVPLYHPAVVLYSASQKGLLKADFQKLSLFV